MEASNPLAILESMLFAAGDEGLTIQQISAVLEIDDKEAKNLLDKLKAEYESNMDRGITLTLLAGTYQLVTKKRFSVYIEKLVDHPAAGGISQAGLETMAIIAYQQPITRIEIEDIRGVSSERPLRTLMEKGLIKEVGRREGVGRAILYGTTKEFLDYFGLQDLKELPPLPEYDQQDTNRETDLFLSQFEQSE